MTSSIKSLISILNCSDFQNSFDSWSKQLANLIWETKLSSKLVTLFGNGGSAADAQHWSAELMCTYKDRTRTPIPAVSLTTDTSILTAWSNDFDFSTAFSRQIEGLREINGLSIGLSTSGKSRNVLLALIEARSRGAKSILITGNQVEERVDMDLHILLPSSDTPTIQTLTQMLYHDVCQRLEPR
jgi:D-sedoheptulose 7-phosphate isomerase